MPQDSNHENLESLVRAVVNSYSEQPSYLPNKDAIIEILGMMRKLLFPGYFENENTELTDLYFYVGSLMMELGNKLQRQVCRALMHDTAVSGSCRADMFGSFSRGAGRLTGHLRGRMRRHRQLRRVAFELAG